MASASFLFLPTIALALRLDLPRLLYYFATATTRDIVTITGLYVSDTQSFTVSGGSLGIVIWSHGYR
jgi:hypothetical protein